VSSVLLVRVTRLEACCSNDSEARSPARTDAAAIDAVSIDKAIRGCYAIDKSALLREAWLRSASSRLPIFSALLFFVFIIIPLLFALSLVFPVTDPVMPAAQARAPWLNLLLAQLHSLASLPLLAPWFAALLQMGIDTARGRKSSASCISNAYLKVVPLTVAALAWWFGMTVGAWLFVLPGLYCLVALWLALPLINDAALPVRRALYVSQQAIHHRWFDVAVIVIFSLIMITLSSLLLVPLFWTLPWFVTINGMLYCNIFNAKDQRRIALT